jgi:acyl-coenzyme A synthetase/AMP-(fatty) acid ligase
MHIGFLTKRFSEATSREAIIFNDRPFSYQWLLDQISHWQGRLTLEGIESGDITVLHSGFSPNAVAILLALIERGCIVLPISNAVGRQNSELIETGQGETIVAVNDDDSVSFLRTGTKASHELYDKLREAAHPGLVLFSSGSTGKSKGAVHDLAALLRKFHTRRHDLRTLAFLLFDHIGGFDTLFYCLSNGSCLVMAEDRTPDAICAAVEKHHVEVLPVAPTFLNLLLLTEAYRRYDLSSLKYITYGAEVMPEYTLRCCAEIFPGVTLLQKYGTSEVGTLRSKSRSSDSLWVKIGGDGYQWRVVDGILQIKAESAMLGYLNAPSPFTPDGWFVTGDCVEVDGEYVRILGRANDLINVGGQKVYPSEVEDILREVPNVAEVTVYGEPNPLLGNIVVARVQLGHEENHAQFRIALKEYARARLDSYKIPIKILFSTENQVTARFKKIRSVLTENSAH